RRARVRERARRGLARLERDRAAFDLRQGVAGDAVLAHLVRARSDQVGRAGAGPGLRAVRQLAVRLLLADLDRVDREVAGALRAAAVAVVHDLLDDQGREASVREDAGDVLAQLEIAEVEARPATADVVLRALHVAAAAPRARVVREARVAVAGLGDRVVARGDVGRVGRLVVPEALAVVVEDDLRGRGTRVDDEGELALIVLPDDPLPDRDRRRDGGVGDRAGLVLACGEADAAVRGAVAADHRGVVGQVGARPRGFADRV